MPFGMFGGRTEIMDLLEPSEGPPPPVLHTGTWNGHASCVAAGLAQLETLTDEHYAHLHRIGDRLREGAREVGDRLGAPLQVTGIGHFSAFHFNDGPVASFADTRRNDAGRIQRLALAMLTRGFHMFGGRTNLSVALDDDDIDHFLAELEPAITEAT